MNNPRGPAPAISFGCYLKSRPGVWLGLVLWLVITALLLLALVYPRLAENRRVFAGQAALAYNAVYEKISINETVLEGFAAMLRLAGDSPVIRQYTAEMRRTYPHIYSVGFQQYVPAARRAEFEQRQRERGHADFRITDFSYEDERQFVEAAPAASYYPTLFGESVNPDVKLVLGLDQFAVPFLRQALIASIRSGKAVATRPFTLAEGGRGYVLYKALEAIPDFDPDSGLDIDSNTVSILIKTDELLRFAGGALPEATARLMYRDTEGGEITESMAATRRPDYLLTFGKRVFQRQLDDFGQPFRLALEADNGLSGRDLAFAVALFCLAGLIGRFYLQNTYQRYLSQLSRERALQALAEERAGLERRVAERTEALGQKTMEIQRLAGKLARQHEDHCRVIARELHDEFGQWLTAIGINTRLLANRIGTGAAGLSAETQGLIDRLHGAMRSLIGRLRPAALDTFGLKVAIEHCIDLFKLGQSGIECRLTLDPAIDRLPDNYAITIYRAIQELVNNAVRHGRPRKIAVSVRLLTTEVVLNVTDDGRGMEAGGPRGYGLTGLSERLTALNGALEIGPPAGRAGPGQAAIARLPLPADYIRQTGDEEAKDTAG